MFDDRMRKIQTLSSVNAHGSALWNLAILGLEKPGEPVGEIGLVRLLFDYAAWGTFMM